MSTAREQFIEVLTGWMKNRMDFAINSTLPGPEDVDPDFQPMPPEFEKLYRRGVEDALGVVLSITDSRVDNEAPFRLINVEGEIVTFYPEDSDALSTDIKGLINELWENINS